MTTIFGKIDISLYQKSLQEKTTAVYSLLSNITDIPQAKTIPSEPTHYRMRAEFSIWLEKDGMHYCMVKMNGKERERVYIDSFDPGSELINFFMQETKKYIDQDPVLLRKLFDIDFLTTLSGQTLISLTYHKKLDDDWHSSAQKLLTKLRSFGHHINIIGRARNQKIIMDEDFVWETLHVENQELHYQQIDNSFTQPNAHIAEKMLAWVQNAVGLNNSDLLELYCGNGNFSIALSRCFHKILATEISKDSVSSAKINIKANNISNINILRMSAEEVTQAIHHVRQFFRIKESNINLDDYDFQTVLVDPPRSGLDENSLHMIQSYKRIIYVSCCPETLAQNLSTLKETHTVNKIAFFDQFPYTKHIETIILLEKK